MCLRLSRKMMGGITYERDENILNLVVKVTKGRNFDLVWCQISNKSGHGAEIVETFVNDCLNKGVIGSVLIELMDRWKAERCPDIGVGGVVPKCNVCHDEFIPQSGISGVCVRCSELQKDSGGFLQGIGQGLTAWEIPSSLGVVTYLVNLSSVRPFTAWRVWTCP